MDLLRSKWAPISLIVIFALLSYGRVVQCGFIWDDDDYVWQNPVLRTWGGLWQIWFEPTSLPQYYPLVHTSFWLEANVFGLPPDGASREIANQWALGYHLVNVTLHAISAFILFRLGKTLRLPGILFAALWFLVNPIHVESVAWVTERKNVLSLLCYLLAAERWIRWHDEQSNRSYLIGSLWLLGALWSKTVVASLPAALLIVVWWRDGKITKRATVGTIPWFVVGALLGCFTVYLEATHVGASNAPWQLVGVERILVAGSACWFYLGSLYWPFDTCFNYLRWELDPPSMLLWLGPILAVLGVGVTWMMRARIGRGPLAVLLLFGGTLVPAIGFFDVYPFRYSFVADHFQYHASIAVLVASSAMLHGLLSSRLSATVTTSIAGLWLLVLSITSMGLLDQYKDFKTLWEHTLAKNPNSTLALTNLGGIATEARDLDSARNFLTRCIALDDTSNEAIVSLGIVEQLDGNLAEAKRLYERGIELKPNASRARNNLAVLQLNLGNTENAIELALRAVEIDPDYYDGHVTLGWALTKAKQWQQALLELQWVLQRTPRALECRLRLVECLVGLERPSKAAAQSLAALRIVPGDTATRQLAAKTLAMALRNQPAASIRSKTTAAIENSGNESASLLPLVADSMRALGETALADAIQGLD